MSSRSDLMHYCAVYRCVVHGIHEEGINPECEYCYFKGDCPRSKLHRLYKPFTITEAEGLKVDERHNPKLMRGEFIPAIVLGDRRSYYWEKGVELPIKRIAVKYHELIKIENHRVLWRSKRRGLKKALNVPDDVEVYVSTVMPDFMLEDVPPEKFASDALKVKADGVIIYDGYDYISMPKEMTYCSLYRAYKRLIRSFDHIRDSMSTV